MRRTLLAAVAAVPLLVLTGFTSASAATDPGPPDLDELVQCLRDHGIDVPDPEHRDGDVVLRFRPDDPEEFRRAMQDCEPDRPAGDVRKGRPVDREKVEEFVECMREHGVPDFPGPGDGEVVLRQHAGPDGPPPPGEARPADPAFDEAREACGSLLPAPGPGERIRVVAPAPPGG